MHVNLDLSGSFLMAIRRFELNLTLFLLSVEIY